MTEALPRPFREREFVFLVTGPEAESEGTRDPGPPENLGCEAQGGNAPRPPASSGFLEEPDEGYSDLFELLVEENQ